MRRAAIAVLATVLALAGCAARAPRYALRRRFRRLFPAAATSSQRSMAERRAAVRSLRASPGSATRPPDESRSAKQLLVAERPDRLRFEVLSPFGTVFVLTAADGRLAAYDARRQRPSTAAAASPENLPATRRWICRSPLAVDLLLGTPPLLARRRAWCRATTAPSSSGSRPATASASLWFDSDLEPLRYERRDAAGYVLLQASFGGYAAVGGVRLPAHISLELPPFGAAYRPRSARSGGQPAARERVFALQTPPGSKEVDLDQVAP